MRTIILVNIYVGPKNYAGRSETERNMTKSQQPSLFWCLHDNLYRNSGDQWIVELNFCPPEKHVQEFNDNCLYRGIKTPVNIHVECYPSL